MLDVRFLREIDQEMPGGKSQVVQVQLKRDGTLGYRNRSDAAEPGEFAALLRHVQKKIAALADRIIAAEISVRPYRLNETTPCPRCEFRSVCRFEVPVNSYLPLAVLGREQVLDQLSQA